MITGNYLYLWDQACVIAWMAQKSSHTCSLSSVTWQGCHSRRGANLTKALKHLEQLELLQYWNILTLAAVGSSYTCFQQMIL